MSSNLTNFVAIRQTKGDVLSPAEYRSIVELIRGILARYNFADLTSGYGALLAHIANHDNPHHDGNADLFNVIVQRIYNIYVNMTQYPLSLADFKTRIVPTMSFFELIRRIVLNRYLYDQVKAVNGSVPATATATLTGDWLGPGITKTMTLSFNGGVASENDFMKLGWGANTTPLPAIFNATTLASDGIDLPIIYETSSENTYLTLDTLGSGFPVPLQLSSNDLTVKLVVVGIPTTASTIFSFRSADDIFQINMTPDGKVSIVLNGTMIIQTNLAVSDGRITVEVTEQGFITLTTTQAGMTISQSFGFTYTSSAIISSGLILIPYEDLFAIGFGLRNFTIYRGYTSLLPTVPVGYVVITDLDGSYLTDYDGNFVIDVA